MKKLFKAFTLTFLLAISIITSCSDKKTESNLEISSINPTSKDYIISGIASIFKIKNLNSNIKVKCYNGKVEMLNKDTFQIKTNGHGAVWIYVIDTVKSDTLLSKSISIRNLRGTVSYFNSLSHSDKIIYKKQTYALEKLLWCSVNEVVDVNGQVSSFNILKIKKDGEIEAIQSNGAYLSISQKKYIESLKPNDYLIIDSVIIYLPDSEVISSHPIVYRIK